ncbi:MAG: hypothetical protein AAF957_29125 [Planctomycetota bacterium]
MFRSRSHALPVALLLLVSGFLLGCASTTFQEVPRADAASELPAEGMCRIYCFRSGQIVGTTRSVEVRVADRLIGEMGQDGYLCWDRPPGRVVAQVLYHGPWIDNKTPEGVFEFDGEAGRVYYFEMHLTERDKQPEFRELNAEEGKAAIAARTPARVK